jgi:hypothetical protein
MALSAFRELQRLWMMRFWSSIIAQQGIFQSLVRTPIVDMVGILVLREIGVLIVSIMGLDGPELGSMKMREEIDACRIVNARMFRATAHAEVTDAPGAGAVRDEAFGKAATKLVIWTSEVI